MDRSRGTLGALSILGMIAVLAFAAGLDTLVTLVGRRYAGTFNPVGIVWVRAATGLVLAASLLLLARFVLMRAPRSPWIAAFYLLVGLYLALAQVLYFAPTVTSWWPPFFDGIVVSRSSYTITSGSFLAILGLMMLLLPRAADR